MQIPLLLLLLPSITMSLPHESSSCYSPSKEQSWPAGSRYIQSDTATIEVILQGPSSGSSIIIIPSLGRDSSSDFNSFSTSLAHAGYFVLRPQPRGTLGSSGPVLNISIEQQAADISKVITTLSASGKAIVLGHAFGHFLAQILASTYPNQVPGIIFAAAQTDSVPADISLTPIIAANLSAPIDERLEALRKGFFTPDHDPRIWLDGWWPATSKMQTDAIKAYKGNMSEIAAGGTNTQLLEVVADQDPFEVKSKRNLLIDRFPERVEQVVVYDASHALFPEQPERVLETVLPWLEKWSKKLGV